VTQNSKLTVGTSYDLNESIWSDTNTALEIRRKNTSLNIGSLWNTKTFDLRNASLTAIMTRKNGWEFNIQGVYEHKSLYQPIRQIVAKKKRCCTQMEFRYDTTTKTFQFQYIILAFPGKTFGFTQSNQGFEVDQSAFKMNETTTGAQPGQTIPGQMPQ